MRPKAILSFAAVLVVALTCAGSALVAQRATAQAAPPAAWRETFWGMQIVAPEPTLTGVKTSSIFLDQRGELMILVLYVPTDNAQIARTYALLQASTGEIVRAFPFPVGRLQEASAEMEEYLRQIGRQTIPGFVDRPLRLPNGYAIGRGSHNVRCAKNYNDYFTWRGAAGIQLAAKALVQLVDEQFPFEFPRECENTAKDRSSDTVFVRGRAVSGAMLDLGDGTWVLSDASVDYRKAATVIRFRGFLESPYLATRPDLLIVDDAELQRVFMQAYTEEYQREQATRVPVEYADEVVYEHFKDRRGR